jgi:hypothetical protein
MELENELKRGRVEVKGYPTQYMAVKLEHGDTFSSPLLAWS